MKNLKSQKKVASIITFQMNHYFSLYSFLLLTTLFLFTSCQKEAMEDLQLASTDDFTETAIIDQTTSASDYPELTPEQAVVAYSKIQALIKTNTGFPLVESVPFVEGNSKATATSRSPLQVIPIFYTITSKIQGYNVDVRNGKLNNNTAIWNHSANQTAAQFWSFHSTGDGYYYIKSKMSDKYLTVKHASKNSKASIVQHTYHSSLIRAQQWKLVSTGSDGYFYIVNRNSGKLLDVKYGSSANGALLWQYDFNGTKAQKFQLNTARHEKPRYSKSYGENGGSSFNLLPPGGLIKAKKISRIYIRHGKYVNSIQVEWELVDGTKVWSKKAGGTGGQGKMITFGNKEYITKITGRAGKYVDQLSFHTSSGRKIGPKGGNGGTSFTINAPANGIKGFYGRSGGLVDKLGVSF